MPEPVLLKDPNPRSSSRVRTGVSAEQGTRRGVGAVGGGVVGVRPVDPGLAVVSGRARPAHVGRVLLRAVEPAGAVRALLHLRGQRADDVTQGVVGRSRSYGDFLIEVIVIRMGSVEYRWFHSISIMWTKMELRPLIWFYTDMQLKDYYNTPKLICSAKTIALKNN